MQTRLNNNHITLTLVSQDDWQVETWPGAWWQLLSNLIENSLQHGFDNKSAGEITIDAQLTDSQIQLTYTDNGHGMNAEQLSNIYEPFFTTARHRGGTGLGMHIVYNLVVQKLGGTIDCQSEPDHGVVFSLEVPLVKV